MAPAQALAAIGSRSQSPLATELGAVASQAQLGVPLDDALRGLVRRLPAPELGAFAAAVKRATKHGAPLSDTLAAQARDARLARRRRIQEEAAKAAPKIQLVVALLLVPSVLLLVAAALAAALLGAHGALPTG
jgi:tight adherence protein C